MAADSLTDAETFRDGPDGRPLICDSSDPEAYTLTMDMFLEKLRGAARGKALDDGKAKVALATGKAKAQGKDWKGKVV